MSQPPSLSSSGLPEVQQEEKTFALIAHLLIFVFGVLGPGIIYLIKKDQSPFVAYHAMQALVFQLIIGTAVFVAYVIYMILTVVTMGIGSICFPIVCIPMAAAFLSIPTALKANSGEWQGYPMIGNIGRPAGM